jgi:uncharacterized protein (DUF58 family)
LDIAWRVGVVLVLLAVFWWVVPTRRLAIAAALASLVALAVPGSELEWLLVVNGALVLIALLDSRVGPSPAALEVSRRLPAAITLGAESDLTWTIRNPSSRKIKVGLADELAPSLRATTRRARGRIPGKGTLRATARLRPARRGRFLPRKLTLRVDGPLGLGARQHTRDLPGELRVFPSFKSKDDAELRLRKARMLEVGLRSARGRGGGTEFDQLREYGVDDEFRRVDWSATARLGKPIVKTFRSERNQTVIVLLDNGRSMAGQVDGVPRVEHAMDAVMAITTVATGLGDKCGLVAFDRDVRAMVPPRHGKSQMARVVEALYDLEPALVESDYAAAFTQTLARVRRRNMLVILTDLVEHSVSEWLLPALPLIVREHLVVVAGVTDPDVARWATSTPSDASGVYRQAAAVTAVSERARVTAKLRGMGATVVDARPGRLAPALADAYLQIKATGKL